MTTSIQTVSQRPPQVAGSANTADRLGSVLLVDDDPAVVSLLELWLRQAGYETESYNSGASFLEGLTQSIPEAVCLDLDMPGMNGLAVLKRVKESHPLLPVVILTGESKVNTVVSAMASGAFDYLVKPANPNKLLATLRNAVDKYRLSLRVVQLEREAMGPGYSGILGRSGAMRNLFRELDKVCRTDIRALVLGESGTGKELVAHALHKNGGRRSGPFVTVNCAAIPESLQESELFGHEKGSFTGASNLRRGRFEQANGGTLFLDEVGELSLALQAKLLRVLQEKRFHRVGGTSEIQSDFRLVSATHQDLAESVRDGSFREDLYYRVAVYELRLPPLRDRGEDILLLARSILEEFCLQDGTAPPRLSAEVAQALMLYSWPGNVRELRNAIERASVARSGPYIHVRDLPERISRYVQDHGFEFSETKFAPALTQGNERLEPVDRDDTDDTSRLLTTENAAAPSREGIETASAHETRLPVQSLESMERRAIEESLVRTNRRIGAVVKELGISRTTLYRKMKKFGL